MPSSRLRVVGVAALLLYMVGMVYLFENFEWMQDGMLSRRTRTMQAMQNRMAKFEETTVIFDEISAELEFALKATSTLDNHRLHRVEAAIRQQKLGPLSASTNTNS
eukprot:SAG31_NODE_4633_length_3083_cov_5.088807_7_plen_106_part_00